MRRVRYCVASSLDGFIAGPHGDADWIVMDSDIDFEGLFAQFDTFLLGRKTFEMMAKAGRALTRGYTTVVFSTTLDPEDYPGVTVVSEGVTDAVTELKEQDGKDIWLFGGGSLFRSLVERELVDTVELGVMPVLLGEGIPLIAEPELRRKLVLEKCDGSNKSGIVVLEYTVDYGKA